MSENVYVVKFGVESEAYQAFAELKNAALTNDYIVSQAYLVKNEGGKLAVKDQFDTGIETADDTGAGTLVGALVGVIGGPVGVLLGAGYGIMVGGAMDAIDITDNVLMINQVSSSVAEGESALLLLASEINEGTFEKSLDKFAVIVSKFDAGEVAEEVDKAVQLERQMQKEAFQKMLEDKKAESKTKIAERQAKIAAHFEELKKKAASKPAVDFDPRLLD